MPSSLDEWAQTAPFSKAVKVACREFGISGREPVTECTFPACECRRVPNAVRDIISTWVGALPSGESEVS